MLFHARSRPVTNSGYSAVPSAMGTTKNLAVGFHSMSDDPAAAVGANRRQRVNGTLEAVEDVHAAVKVNLERLVVVVAADFTGCHGDSPGDEKHLAEP